MNYRGGQREYKKNFQNHLMCISFIIDDSKMKFSQLQQRRHATSTEIFLFSYLLYNETVMSTIFQLSFFFFCSFRKFYFFYIYFFFGALSLVESERYIIISWSMVKNYAKDLFYFIHSVLSEEISSLLLLSWKLWSFFSMCRLYFMRWRKISLKASDLLKDPVALWKKDKTDVHTWEKEKLFHILTYSHIKRISFNWPFPHPEIVHKFYSNQCHENQFPPFT